MKSLVFVLWVALLCLLHLCICLPHPGGNRIRSNLPILSSDLKKSSRLTDLFTRFKVRNLLQTLTDVTKDEKKIDLPKNLKKSHRNVAKQIRGCKTYYDNRGRIERFHYQNNVNDCFLLELHEEITVSFDDRMDIEESGLGNCDYDFVFFTDRFVVKNSRGNEEKYVCGSVAPRPFTLHGPLFINFVTDASQGGYGFALNWAPSGNGNDNDNVNENGNTIAGCGVPKVASHNIVHGSKVHRGQYPWQISMILPAYNNFHFCGASLVSDRWAITAAHCFFNEYGVRVLYENDVKLVLGEFDRTSHDGTEKTVSIARIIIHERYREDPKSSQHDLALMKLAERVQFTNYIIPICLGKTPLPRGTSCHTSGWGDTQGTGDKNVLNHVELFLVQCSTNHNDESNVCAENGIKGACMGDSGGPLACMKNGAYYLQGATSFGNIQCGTDNTYFTNIAHYYPWIQQKSGGEL